MRDLDLIDVGIANSGYAYCPSHAAMLNPRATSHNQNSQQSRSWWLLDHTPGRIRVDNFNLRPHIPLMKPALNCPSATRSYIPTPTYNYKRASWLRLQPSFSPSPSPSPSIRANGQQGHTPRRCAHRAGSHPPTDRGPGNSSARWTVSSIGSSVSNP